jgi:hypothetical protein
MRYFHRPIADALRTLRVAAQDSGAGTVRVNYKLGVVVYGHGSKGAVGWGGLDLLYSLTDEYFQRTPITSACKGFARLERSDEEKSNE